MVLARAVHVSIRSRGQSYKTVFRCLTLYTESLPGLKVISLFEAFSSFISTVSIHLSGSYLSPSTVQCLLNAFKIRGNVQEEQIKSEILLNFSKSFIEQIDFLHDNSKSIFVPREFSFENSRSWKQ